MARILLLANPMLRGTDVQALQKRIAQFDIGSGVFADGVFGTRTATALKAFQQANAERVTGIADAAFQARWGISGTPSAIKSGLPPVNAPVNPPSASDVTSDPPKLGDSKKMLVMILGGTVGIALLGLMAAGAGSGASEAVAGIGSAPRRRRRKLSRRKSR